MIYTLPLDREIANLEQLTAVEGWDDERGEPISPRQWQAARLVLSRSASKLAVFVGASGDGCVHLTWAKAGGDRGVLEIGTTRWWWSILRLAGQDSPPTEVANLRDAVGRIAMFSRD
jgi:hypothetical protein